MQKGKVHVAKFVPRFNGPYTVESAHPEWSTYTLVIPGAKLNFCRTFHSLQLKPWTPNNDKLFLLRSSRTGPPSRRPWSWRQDQECVTDFLALHLITPMTSVPHGYHIISILSWSSFDLIIPYLIAGFLEGSITQRGWTFGPDCHYVTVRLTHHIDSLAPHYCSY